MIRADCAGITQTEKKMCYQTSHCLIKIEIASAVIQVFLYFLSSTSNYSYVVRNFQVKITSVILNVIFSHLFIIQCIIRESFRWILRDFIRRSLPVLWFPEASPFNYSLDSDNKRESRGITAKVNFNPVMAWLKIKLLSIYFLLHFPSTSERVSLS